MGRRVVIQTRPQALPKREQEGCQADACCPSAPQIPLPPPGPWQRGAKSLQCARTGLGTGEAGVRQKGAMPALESRQEAEV